MDKLEFLARVRKATYQTRPGFSDSKFDWRPLADIENNRAALVARFTKELGAVGGKVESVSEQDLIGRIVEIARERKVQGVATGSALGEQMTGKLREEGFEISTDAARADLGLSTVECAIAETGTVVLASGTDKSRLATVLPPRYLAIVHVEQIVPNFVSAIGILKKKFGESFPAAITLVTGPSRTADIELSLTIGVHGPGEMIVLVVE